MLLYLSCSENRNGQSLTICVDNIGQTIERGTASFTQISKTRENVAVTSFINNRKLTTDAFSVLPLSAFAFVFLLIVMPPTLFSASYQLLIFNSLSIASSQLQHPMSCLQITLIYYYLVYQPVVATSSAVCITLFSNPRRYLVCSVSQQPALQRVR